MAFLNQRHDFWFAALRAFTDKAKTPRTKTQAAFRFLNDMNSRENFRGCSFINVVTEITDDATAIRTVIQNHKEDLRTFFRDILQEHAARLADHIYLLFEGALIESQLFRNPWPVERATTLAAKLFD